MSWKGGATKKLLQHWKSLELRLQPGKLRAPLFAQRGSSFFRGYAKGRDSQRRGECQQTAGLAIQESPASHVDIG